MPAGAHVLDLGCGGGQDSQVMLEQGFEVTPLAGSAGLARIAQAGPWAALEILQGLGHSYEQEERTWLQVTARKADHQRMQP